ncbi:hypothetical protein [Streptomyces griseorubiginosus]|uniref:hypothetical protein n=1 Tax=Streptomyces griseorubiginosus TaxID=67304 RepID=UPI002E822564|nr:hypothetical protein [Streptomyces griseorubiginosus]WUB58844.1 hypothetical protein OG942_43510 [Streptomyces griseorubiginosus]
MPTSETVKKLQAEARATYEKHNTPERAAAFRLQRGQAQTNGNAAAGAPRGPRT